MAATMSQQAGCVRQCQLGAGVRGGSVRQDRLLTSWACGLAWLLTRGERRGPREGRKKEEFTPDSHLHWPKSPAA